MAKKKSKPDVCPKCGGAKRGRGYAHQPPCEPSKRAASGTSGAGIDGRMLRGMDVGQLLALRDKVAEALAAKGPEIDAEIQRLKALKDSLSAT